MFTVSSGKQIKIERYTLKKALTILPMNDITRVHINDSFKNLVCKIFELVFWQN